MKITAAAAEAFEVNVAPHNFYGHLCTDDERAFLQRLCRTCGSWKPTSTGWRDHELFTHLPEYADGYLVILTAQAGAPSPTRKACARIRRRARAGC